MKRSTQALAAAIALAALLPMSARAESLREARDDLARLQTELAGLKQEAGQIQIAQSNFSASQVDAIEERMNTFERQMQSLTSKIERLEYVQRQLADRMDRFQSDVDYRLTVLEGGTPAAPSTAGSGGDYAGGAQVLGSVSTDSLGQVRNQANRGTDRFSQPSGALPAGTPEEQYDYAFGLLRQADYDGAQQALQSFIAQNAGHPYVANAKYWLGETYYVQGDYDQAAQAFAVAYRDHVNGPKSADSLLKLGLSLSYKGDKTRACAVLQELENRVGSNAPRNLLSRAQQERQALGC